MNPNTQDSSGVSSQGQQQVPVQAPVQTPVSTPISNFKSDPFQTTLSTGTKVLSFAAMITSFINLFKRFMSK